MRGSRREKRQREFHTQLKDVSRYLYKVAHKHKQRSPVYSLEDLVQEGLMVLWKILNRYPKLGGRELIALYGKALRERYVDLFRPRVMRMDGKVRSLDCMANFEEDELEPPDIREIIVCPRNMLPWDFYTKSLRALEKRLGRKAVRQLVRGNRQGRYFMKKVLRTKEEIMKVV